MSVADVAREALCQMEPQLRFAMEHALTKNGPMPSDPVRMGSIVINEASEALCEALKMTKERPNASHRGAVGDRPSMIVELMQTAGVAILAAVELQAQENQSE